MFQNIVLQYNFIMYLQSEVNDFSKLYVTHLILFSTDTSHQIKVIFFITEEPFFSYKTSTHLDAKAALLTPQASSLIFI